MGLYLANGSSTWSGLYTLHQRCRIDTSLTNLEHGAWCDRTMSISLHALCLIVFVPLSQIGVLQGAIVLHCHEFLRYGWCWTILILHCALCIAGDIGDTPLHLLYPVLQHCDATNLHDIEEETRWGVQSVEGKSEWHMPECADDPRLEQLLQVCPQINFLHFLSRQNGRSIEENELSSYWQAVFTEEFASGDSDKVS